MLGENFKSTFVEYDGARRTNQIKIILILRKTLSGCDGKQFHLSLFPNASTPCFFTKYAQQTHF